MAPHSALVACLDLRSSVLAWVMHVHWAPRRFTSANNYDAPSHIPGRIPAWHLTVEDISADQESGRLDGVYFFHSQPYIYVKIYEILASLQDPLAALSTILATLVCRPGTG